MRENKTCPHLGWQQMSTEQLDQLLQAELEKEHPNEEVVLPILHELQDRDRDIPVETTPEVLQIAEKLKTRNTSSTHSIFKYRWLAGIAAAAAVIFIVILSVSPTARAESFFDVLFRWTSSIFEFIDPDKTESTPVMRSDFATDNPGLQQLYDKVTELGVTESVVPTWLPQEFTLSDLTVFSAPGGIKTHGKFENGDNAILITYRISTSIAGKLEKKEADVEVFDSGGVDHFIIVNNDSISVTWITDGVECVMNTNLPKEDVYTIIKSIYRSELTN